MRFLRTATLLVLTAEHAYAGNTILTNGYIYTVDDSNPWVDAVAIDEDGVIIGVGAFPDLYNAFGRDDDSVVLDLNDQLLLPGFHDVDLHAIESVVNAELCPVPERTNLYDIPSVLGACRNGGRVRSEESWIVGIGIDLGLIIKNLDMTDPSGFPIAILDAFYASNQPVLVLDSLGHGAIANSEAFRLAGFDGLIAAGESPQGGKLLYNFDQEFTGIVTENAQHPLRDKVFPPTDENEEAVYEGLLDVLELLRENGVTSISDVGGFWRQAGVDAWERASDDGELTVRASNALYVYPDWPLTQQLRRILSRARSSDDPLLRFNQAKFQVDGTFALASAAIKTPYDDVDFAEKLFQARGLHYFGSTANLLDYVQPFVDNGFKLQFHVAGDRAARIALDVVSTVGSDTGPHHLTQCLLIDEVDRSRIASLGVIANFQLSQSFFSQEYSHLLENLIGEERAEELLPALEVFEAGATIAVGSNWDADPLSPLLKIQTILTRPGDRTFSDVETVIRMFTINAAELLRQEDKVGSIEVGKYADLVVIDDNIFDMDEDEIADAEVVATLLQGEFIYGSLPTYDIPVTDRPTTTPTQSPVDDRNEDEPPTTAPTPFCEDDFETTFLIDGEEQDCRWLSGRSDDILALCRPGEEVYTICRETCGVCEDFCDDDPSTPFLYEISPQRSVMITCPQLADRERDIDKACESAVTASLCRETCETCSPTASPRPSASPTASPSGVVPTLQPTVFPTTPPTIESPTESPAPSPSPTGVPTGPTPAPSPTSETEIPTSSPIPSPSPSATPTSMNSSPTTLPTDSPAPSPSPTGIPTFIPFSPTPYPTPGQTPGPTPAPVTCRPPGVSCFLNSQCCTRICFGSSADTAVCATGRDKNSLKVSSGGSDGWEDRRYH